MKRHARFFAVAREAALRGSGKYRLGAVITKGNRIVSIGTNNMVKTHPMISTGTYKTIHAETAAIIGGLRDRLVGCVIYVYRERGNGDLGLAKPCVDCACILRNHGIRTAYYSDPLEPCGYGMEKYR